MDEKLKKFAQQLAGFWKKLTTKKKIILVSSALAAIILIIVGVSVLNTTKYELLSSGLSEEEASQVYNAVSAQGVPVKVQGTTIYVEKGKADRLRMILAEQGLPEGNLSYDLYSSGSNFAETDKDKEIKQLQQIQNRLQDTIETIPGVRQAIVTIAKTSESTYVLETDKVPTTASVKLTLQNGTTLSKKQVNGIVQLVANSVSGLTRDNVTVEDSDGSPLSTGDDSADVTSEQLTMKTQYEGAVKAKLSQMLTQIYGSGNFNVVVNADMDFSSKNTLTTSYTTGVPNYVTVTSEVSMSGGSASGTSGTPTYANSNSTGAGAYNSKYSETTSTLVGSVQEQIQQKGGRLLNLTVSIMLNSRDAAAAATDVEALKQNVAGAVGTAVNNISIGQMSFSSAMAEQSSEVTGWSLPPLNANSLVLYAVVAAMLLLIIISTLILVLLGRRRRRKRQLVLAQQALLAAQEEAAKREPTRPQPIPIKSIEETIEEAQTNSVKREIESFADKKPELVAQILKNWLKD